MVVFGINIKSRDSCRSVAYVIVEDSTAYITLKFDDFGFDCTNVYEEREMRLSNDFTIIEANFVVVIVGGIFEMLQSKHRHNRLENYNETAHGQKRHSHID